MFKFLTPKPDAVAHNTAITTGTTIVGLRQTPLLLAASLTGILFITGCQPEPVPEDNASQTSEKARAEANKPVPQSDSATARIEQFQPLYVTQVQRLQRRLQAEYESLQAADAPVGNNSLLNGAAKPTDSATNTETETTTNPTASSTVDANTVSAPATTEQANVPATTTADAAIDTAANDPDAEINTSTEIGERDLEVLKRISLEPHEPKILTKEQIIERYQQAIQALYQPAVTPLSAQEGDTLLNMATLVPQLFEHAEIAERVSIKSPALARLIIQHQVWQQIEAQQALDMQQMKQTQQQEFESLMTKFNDTIEGYDEQIAKYEQTLKEFQ